MRSSSAMSTALLVLSAIALIVGLIRLATADPTPSAGADRELPGFVADWLPGVGDGNRDGIGVVDVDGPIQFGGDNVSPFASTRGAERVARRLRELRRDPHAKAIVLRVNSPGGTLAASQAIYEEVRLTAREANKPVIVSMSDMAASGGYYISAPATAIVAHPGTMTGSIGVIMAGLNFKGLMEKHGVRMVSYQSGKNKDIMAFWRDPRPDEIELMQAMIDDAYGQFVTAVADNRGIPREKLLPIADGRVLLGTQAKELGLVDHLGGFRDAVRLAAEAAGLDADDPHLIRRSKEQFWEQLSAGLGSLAHSLAGRGGSAGVGGLDGVIGTGLSGALPLPIWYLAVAPAGLPLGPGMQP